MVATAGNLAWEVFWNIAMLIHGQIYWHINMSITTVDLAVAATSPASLFLDYCAVI